MKTTLLLLMASASLAHASPHFYLSSLSSMVVGRPLTGEEGKLVATKGQGAVRTVVEKWTEDAFFPETVRRMIQHKLKVSGVTPEIDGELPGNLAAYLAKKHRPFSELLTADYCVSGVGMLIPCDAGAPYNAGVLTTRSFLSANQGRFNLSRAGTLLREFACREYPMEPSLEPRLPREKLIPMFQSDQGSDEFGNGSACYSCHSQFGAHAQLFVKFDRDGYWAPFASGEQDPKGETGASYDGLYASHFLDPREAASSSSQMLGAQVANLAEAAKVLVRSEAFHHCSVRTILKYFLRLDEPQVMAIPNQLVEDIYESARQRESNPSFQALTVEALSAEPVQRSLIQSRLLHESAQGT